MLLGFAFGLALLRYLRRRGMPTVETIAPGDADALDPREELRRKLAETRSDVPTEAVAPEAVRAEAVPTEPVPAEPEDVGAPDVDPGIDQQRHSVHEHARSVIEEMDRSEASPERAPS
jgi:hypothetical protein